MKNFFQVNKFIVFPLVITLVIWGVVLILFVYKNYKESRKPSVLGDVNVTTNVFGCLNTFKIRPDNRGSANLSTTVDVEIYSSDNVTNHGGFSGNTTGLGEIFVDFCGLGTPIFLQSDNYNIFVRGKSHLRMMYFRENEFLRTSNYINLASNHPWLIPGDVNSPQDNEINSLDITHLIKNKDAINGIDINYDETYDLDLDGDIDITDINILINNFYKIGDDPV